MLVLKRNRRESIHLGDDVKITLEAIMRDAKGRMAVKLEIEAPRRVNAVVGKSRPNYASSPARQTVELYRNQPLRIGRDVVIAVTEIHHDDAHIGINAPRSLRVLRGETYARQSLENMKQAVA